MRTGTADPNAASHAGTFGDFEVLWPPELAGTNKAGWYLALDGADDIFFGSYATSQAAFGAAKDAIDNLIKGGEV